ncbi:hypothetical protein IMSHALPRED_005532 [Imshaugia aleurites]|uniref:Uncharacterized protein n=1 Tax=Imshaugia aleurites TaxID=172621 RepID=A0A8H3IBI9_9LECA|nr:hypothetical protein IMSHALPRED_005532 [Imshaugia aleurites]
MARTWFAGSPTAQRGPPPKGTVSTEGNQAQANEGVSSKNEIAVNDCATAHQITPTKATHLDSESHRSTTCSTPALPSQKEQITQPTKEAIDASANLAKLIQQHSKFKDPQEAASSEKLATSRPEAIVETFAPFSSAPRRAPTAQMVPLAPNAAGTTARAAIATPKTSTTSLSGPCSSPTTISNPQAMFPPTALRPLSLVSILPSSPIVSSKKSTPKKSTSKTPKITLTPAPATAPSAFKDAALAAHVQNTKFLLPVKQETNGVKKRQNVRTSPPPKSVLTPQSVPEGKRGRGRPRTRREEQPLQESRQHRPPLQPSTTTPRPCLSNQPKPPLPLQQQQSVTLNTNSDLVPDFCSEEPRL